MEDGLDTIVGAIVAVVEPMGMTAARHVYVISDLHLGGSYPDPGALHPARRRGFRMMTRGAELAAFIEQLTVLPATPKVELVINGDFVDFLAEEKATRVGARWGIDPTADPMWTPFRAGRGEAKAAFADVVARDQAVFDALASFVACGKRLTIVLGNHDIELTLPDVRAALERELGPGDVHFFTDGQAMDLGEVLIDHGNLFDPANVVDHDRLRVVRALYSRGWFDELAGVFGPPAGSRLVTDVMNPIKLAYGFIDLLKPESEPLLALLVALEPSYRGLIDDAAAALARAAKTLVPRRGVPFAYRNVAADDPGAASVGLRDAADTGAGAPTALDGVLAEILDDDDARALAALGRGGTQPADVAGGTWRARWSLFRLLIGDDTSRDPENDLAKRLPLVQKTLRVLTRDHSFDRGHEGQRYLDAVELVAGAGPERKGYRAVVFGHTHHAKDLMVASVGARYFNTGTWANLMRFPATLTARAASQAEVLAALRSFATDLRDNKLDGYLEFHPTYVRLELDDDGRLLAGELAEYDWKRDRLA